MAVTVVGVSDDVLRDVMGLPTVDRRVSQVDLLSFPVLDRDSGDTRGLLAKALQEGNRVDVDGERWTITAQERSYIASGLLLTLEAQSGLGAALRSETGPRSAKNVTPADWLKARAKAHGGTAVVQPGAKRRDIVQKRNESTLSVLQTITSDTNTSWVVIGNVLYAGTPWWAFQGGTDLPTWSTPLTDALALGFESRSSTADDADSATATLTVPNEVARQLRPWHRLDISKAAPMDDGLWLVQAVAHDYERSPGTVELHRPRKSVVNKASQSTPDDTVTSGGGDYSGYDGEWVPGADKVWPGCTRTPKQMVAVAHNYLGQTGWANQCQRFISVIAHDPYIGGPLLAKSSWYNMLSRAPSTPHGTDRNAPAGSLVVWSGPHRAGHIAIAVGNGEMITTTDGAITKMPIGSYIGWGYYLGWMAPAQYK